MQTAPIQSRTPTLGLLNFGAVEALWKRGHLGLGFTGITLGSDPDRQYGNIVRTGFYALLNIVQTEVLRLGIRTGVDFQEVSANRGAPVDRVQASEMLVFDWALGRFRGNVTGLIGLDAQHVGLADPHLRVSAETQFRFLSLNDLNLSVGADITLDHDPLREFMNLASDNLVASVYMEASWVTLTSGHRDHGIIPVIFPGLFP